MKMFLISDNLDTKTGMRLSGVEGVVVNTKEEAEKTLKETMQREDIGIVLMTAEVISMIEELVYDYKLNTTSPLIIEIPDRHGNGRTQNSITKYVEEAIGVKLG